MKNKLFLSLLSLLICTSAYSTPETVAAIIMRNDVNAKIPTFIDAGHAGYTATADAAQWVASTGMVSTWGLLTTAALAFGIYNYKERQKVHVELKEIKKEVKEHRKETAAAFKTVDNKQNQHYADFVAFGNKTSVQLDKTSAQLTSIENNTQEILNRLPGANTIERQIITPLTHRLGSGASQATSSWNQIPQEALVYAQRILRRVRF